MLGGALRLAGKLIGPGLRGKLGGARGLQNIANQALASGGASAGFTAAGQLMSGEGLDIPEILAYGLADTVTGGLAVGGARALRGTKGLKKAKVTNPTTKKLEEVVVTPKEIIGSGAEFPANVVASILTPMGVSAVLNKQPQQVQQSAQTQQVDQQQLQRMLLNEGLLAGQYLPGTMFQGLGVQPPQSLMQQYLNDQGPTVRMDPASMAAIVGL